jgi:hypothetical protein
MFTKDQLRANIAKNYQKEQNKDTDQAIKMMASSYYEMAIEDIEFLFELLKALPKTDLDLVSDLEYIKTIFQRNLAKYK